MYDESLPRYAALAQQIAELTAMADQAYLASAKGNGIGVLNSLSWDRTEWLKVDETWQKRDRAGTGRRGFERSIPCDYRTDGIEDQA